MHITVKVVATDSAVTLICTSLSQHCCYHCCPSAVTVSVVTLITISTIMRGDFRQYSVLDFAVLFLPLRFCFWLCGSVPDFAVLLLSSAVLTLRDKLEFSAVSSLRFKLEFSAISNLRFCFQPFVLSLGSLLPDLIFGCSDFAWQTWVFGCVDFLWQTLVFGRFEFAVLFSAFYLDFAVLLLRDLNFRFRLCVTNVSTLRFCFQLSGSVFSDGPRD